MSVRFAILATVVAVLSACASPTPYRSLAAGDGYSYSEQRIERNRFRVTFSGNAATPRQTVQDYVLYRAAELTLGEGADYFVITNRSITPEPYVSGNDTRVGIGIGSGGVSIGTGVSLGVGRPASGPASASAEIVIPSGAKPTDLRDAFDARAVRRNLAPRIARTGT